MSLSLTNKQNKTELQCLKSPGSVVKPSPRTQSQWESEQITHKLFPQSNEVMQFRASSSERQVLSSILNTKPDAVDSAPSHMASYSLASGQNQSFAKVSETE